MRCEFLKEHRGEFGPIRKACGILRVPESEYYDYVKRRKSNAQIEREALEGFVAERFGLHKGRYGYRRINRELVSVNIFFTVFTNVFPPIAPTSMRRFRQCTCAAFGA